MCDLKAWNGCPEHPERSGWHWIEDADGLRLLLWRGDDWPERMDRGEWQDGYAVLSARDRAVGITTARSRCRLFWQPCAEARCCCGLRDRSPLQLVPTRAGRRPDSSTGLAPTGRQSGRVCAPHAYASVLGMETPWRGRACRHEASLLSGKQSPIRRCYLRSMGRRAFRMQTEAFRSSTGLLRAFNAAAWCMAPTLRKATGHRPNSLT